MRSAHSTLSIVFLMVAHFVTVQGMERQSVFSSRIILPSEAVFFSTCYTYGINARLCIVLEIDCWLTENTGRACNVFYVTNYLDERAHAYSQRLSAADQRLFNETYQCSKIKILQTLGFDEYILDYLVAKNMLVGS